MWITNNKLEDYQFHIDDKNLDTEKHNQLFNELMAKIQDKEITEKLRRNYEEARIIYELERIRDTCTVQPKRN